MSLVEDTIIFYMNYCSNILTPSYSPHRTAQIFFLNISQIFSLLCSKHCNVFKFPVSLKVKLFFNHSFTRDNPYYSSDLNNYESLLGYSIYFSGSLAFPQTWQTCSCLRTFALILPSAGTLFCQVPTNLSSLVPIELNLKGTFYQRSLSWSLYIK